MEMENTFGKKLKEARKAKQFTQKKLADIIGAKHNSISDWENDKNKPDPDTIELLCGVLDITPNYLLATSLEEFSPIENLLVKKYRSLDPFGQETVGIVLDREAERVKTISQQADRIAELEPILAQSAITIRMYAYMNKIASAGSGFYFDDIPTDTIEAPYCKGADFIVGVNGDSMEPDYHDGDKLYIQKAKDLSFGDVGIFTVWNECFVKELGERGLISKNPAYNDIPGTEDVRLIGRVLGKVESN